MSIRVEDIEDTKERFEDECDNGASDDQDLERLHAIPMRTSYASLR